MVICWPPTLNCVVWMNASTVFSSSFVATPSSVKPLRPYFCLHGDQDGNLAAAGLAPGAPEVHENHFPFEAGECHIFSLQILERYIRLIRKRGGLAGRATGRRSCSCSPRNPPPTTMIATARRNDVLALFILDSGYFTNRFRNVKRCESQVSSLKKINPPMKSSSAPLNTSTVWRCFRKRL